MSCGGGLCFEACAPVFKTKATVRAAHDLAEGGSRIPALDREMDTDLAELSRFQHDAMSVAFPEAETGIPDPDGGRTQGGDESCEARFHGGSIGWENAGFTRSIATIPPPSVT